MTTVFAVEASFCGQKRACFVGWRERDTANGGLSGARPRVYCVHPHRLVAPALLTNRGVGPLRAGASPPVVTGPQLLKRNGPGEP